MPSAIEKRPRRRVILSPPLPARTLDRKVPRPGGGRRGDGSNDCPRSC
ncbi:hypothetical protein BDA96_09G247400 [Sorghum bicolor]|uniref:Uncharacterized protein n=1 Tax=Sorghum bicolor TaxID=4558 RepID=A0A921QBK2_SORBI|nr:hypothetical protein BDA96_09G247400 [Sorghum bicolor]